jgi:addiction module HigA family antidote
MKAKRLYGFEPDYAVIPGETLREVMESMGMTQRELAARTDLTVQSISRILKGVQPITCETANRLELATGVPARLWNQLEVGFREQTAKIKELDRLKSGLDWLQTIPTRELVARGEIPAQEDQALLLRETLAFYGVSSVDAWHSVWDQPAVAALRSTCFESDPGSASAWIRMGERQAQKVECAPYDAVRFKEALHTVRNLTMRSPAEFESTFKKCCASAGVAVALVREMKKVPWNGATEWLSPTKAMILLNLRGKGEDKFWFSFFHEAGHVLHDNKTCVLINDGTKDDPREVRAHKFAADFLIPAGWDAAIIAARSSAAIRKLAQEIGVSAGIVAGRYQYLTKKWNYHRDLIRTFTWKHKS